MTVRVMPGEHFLWEPGPPAEYPPHGVPITFTPPRRFDAQVIPPAEPPLEKAARAYGQNVGCEHNSALYRPELRLLTCPDCGMSLTDA